MHNANTINQMELEIIEYSRDNELHTANYYCMNQIKTKTMTTPTESPCLFDCGRCQQGNKRGDNMYNLVNINYAGKFTL